MTGFLQHTDFKGFCVDFIEIKYIFVYPTSVIEDDL